MAGRHTRILATLFTFSLIFNIWSVAQAVNSASMHGTVTDAKGAAVVGAQIKATQTSTGQSRSTVSGSDGSYNLPNLPVGPYQLEVTAGNYEKYSQKGIVLQVGEDPTINAVMKIGNASETIEVTADAATVETRETSVSTVIDQRSIVELPLNGRQAAELVILAGAASNTTIPGNDLISTKNYGGNNQLNSAFTISVAGGQVNATNYLLDGGDNIDAFSNVNLPFPFPDAIQEFSVETSTASARIGVHSGATVSVVTKSGTNQFHGDAFEFIRNAAVNAQNFFTPAGQKDTLKRNQYGGTVGGPIVKNKLMFFAGYQGTKVRQAPPITTAFVPTAAALSGDFKQLESYTATNAVGCLGGSPSPAGALFKQLNTTYFDTNDHVKPGILMSPAALKLVSYLPTSTDPCGKVVFGIPILGDENQVLARIDYLQSSKNTFYGRYFLSHYSDPPIFDGKNILTATKAGQLSLDQSLILSDTYIFSPHLVSVLHGTGTRLAIYRGTAPNLINFGTLGVNISNPIANALVASVTNYFNVASGTATPGHFNDDTFQVAEDMDYTHGRHDIKFGADWIHYRLNELSNQLTNGQFAFGGTPTGDALSDLLLGLPTTFSQGNPEQENWRQSYIGLYVNDSFKLRSNLVINAGLRWEPYLPAADRYNRGSSFSQAAFAAGTRSTVFPNAPPGLFFCGDSQTPCSFIDSHYKNFSPRLGFVWDPKGKGTFSVRGGYAIFYDNPEVFYFDRFADNSPYGSSIKITNPPGGFDSPYTGQSVPVFPTAFPNSTNATFFPNGVYINIPQNTRPTYVQQWNFGLQKELPHNWLVSATYLGSKTTHLWAGYEADAPVYIPGNDCSSSATAVPTHGAGTSACSTTKNEQVRRVLNQINQANGAFFSTLSQTSDDASSSYNGLLISTTHRFSQHYSMLANYTWSHCISDFDFSGELASGARTISNPNNLLADMGNCAFDIRHIFNLSFVGESPRFQNHTVQWIMGNWQYSTLAEYNSGTHFSVMSGTDNSLTGVGNDRADIVGNPNTGGCEINGVFYPVRTVNCWFNTSAFTTNAIGTFGDSARNSVPGPGFLTFNTAVARVFQLRERLGMMFRFEAFNLFNHPNFLNPGVASAFSSSSSSTVGKTDYGKIDAARDPRILQAAIKLIF